MKFEDFPIEQVAFITYQDMDIVIREMLQSDLVPIGIKPFFFTRLRKALRYLGIDSSSIVGLNFGNYQKYYEEIFNIYYNLYNKYINEITSVFSDTEITKKYNRIDLIGDGMGEVIDLDN